MLTGGFAINERYVWDSRLDDIMLGGVDVNDTGDLCGGFWGDGISGVHWELPRITAKQACGDAILLNNDPWRNQISTAELVTHDGTIGGDYQGGLLSAVHLAGGFGGFRCDGTDMGNDVYGVAVDNAVAPIANREFVIGATCPIDTMTTAAVLLNDQHANGGNADLGGWEASTQAGHGIVVQKWANGAVELRGSKIYNNCGSGVYVEDSSAHVLAGPTTAITANGNASLGSTCTTWQTANPGHGYGIEASVATSNIASFAQPYSNTAGSFNSNVGGSATVGGSDASSLNVLGSLSATVTGTGDLTGVYLNETNGGNGGKSASLYFEDNGVVKWQMAKAGNNIFNFLDAANGYTAELSMATGGNVTIGEVSTNLLTVTGSISPTAAYELNGTLVASATTPTFTSGACSGALGTAAGTAAFTVSTGTGTCGSTFTLGMPTAAHGWVCDANDEAIAGSTLIRETTDSTSSVSFTNYSVGSSPAATGFPTSHTVKVKCAAY